MVLYAYWKWLILAWLWADSLARTWRGETKVQLQATIANEQKMMGEDYEFLSLDFEAIVLWDCFEDDELTDSWIFEYIILEFSYGIIHHLYTQIIQICNYLDNPHAKSLEYSILLAGSRRLDCFSVSKPANTKKCRKLPGPGVNIASNNSEKAIILHTLEDAGIIFFWIREIMLEWFADIWDDCPKGMADSSTTRPMIGGLPNACSSCGTIRS